MAQLLELGPVFAGPQGVAAALAAMTRRAVALKAGAVEPAGSTTTDFSAAARLVIAASTAATPCGQANTGPSSSS